MTIGDELDAKRINWAWYAGAWQTAIADGTRPPEKAREVIYAPLTAGGSPDFQPHHQPFNYYCDSIRKAGPRQRTAHLKDYGDLLADIGAGRLPAVSFYKPQGNLNQHPGYASIAAGDEHIAELVAKLRAGPQWKHMVIVITYDEFGGAWDHVAPPQGDLMGPGIASSGIDHFASRQAGNGRSYAVRHGLHPASDLAPIRSASAARNHAARPGACGARRAAHGRSDQRAEAY